MDIKLTNKTKLHNKILKRLNSKKNGGSKFVKLKEKELQEKM